MGRAFEYRKETKLKRWGNISRVFTRLGKQIYFATRKGGQDPNTNSRLRFLICQAKKKNMPKANIDKAIKRAVSIEKSRYYKKVIYECYAPFGVAIIIEALTDNSIRTVASIKSYFNKYRGSLGVSGSVQFLFDYKCVFELEFNTEINLKILELDLIDFGVDKVEVDKIMNIILIYGEFNSYALINNFLLKNHYQINSCEFKRIPIVYKDVTEEQQIQIENLISKLEEDEDIQYLYHNMRIK